jgi:poly-gamma-glutamate capsule biosynthesis protein CapA/YwtB (metallophosphatase superfamily)
MPRRPVTMSLCGDVMLGRGVDQILPHPGDPRLHEPYVRDARHYVELAERVNGPIPRSVDYSWPWGDALDAFAAYKPDARVVNLETSVTRDGYFSPDKSLHYRMSPANLPCLVAARPDACVLANNHLLDFGRAGLSQTLDSLSDGRLRVTGAGPDLAAALRPAAIPLVPDGRVLVFSYAMSSSGVPLQWAATAERAGVAFVSGPSAAEADRIVGRVHEASRPDDLVVVSLHWGSNWGYPVTRRQVRFARRLVDGVHGHSSHHARPIEVYRDRLILYGCGDLIDDYEGIAGHEEFRDDLRLLYIAMLEPHTGALVDLHIVPLQARRMRLHRASADDTAWLRTTLNRISDRFGTRIGLETDGSLALAR